jgi:hypothetical protein
LRVPNIFRTRKFLTREPSTTGRAEVDPLDGFMFFFVGMYALVNQGLREKV